MSTEELFYVTKDGYHVPQLAFGLYKVSKSECKNVVCNAILTGYRHFDCAPAYENEREVGEALSFMICDGAVSRKDLYICSKVWKDAVVAGRNAVRQSIENSISDLCCEYLDLAMVHWPVNSHVDAYKELELMVKEGKIRSLGLSNYFPEDYETLLASNISVHPVVCQMQVSPFMYRSEIIHYFQKKNILIESHKSLNRGERISNDHILENISKKHNKSPAQIMIRWGIQKSFCVICKTSSKERMVENRDVLDFVLTDDDMQNLDNITTKEEIQARKEHEFKSRCV